MNSNPDPVDCGLARLSKITKCGLKDIKKAKIVSPLIRSKLKECIDTTSTMYWDDPIVNVLKSRIQIDTKREIYEEFVTRVLMINYEKGLSVYQYIEDNIYFSNFIEINDDYRNYLKSVKKLTHNKYFNILYCGTPEELMEERHYKNKVDIYFDIQNFINCGYLNNFPWDCFSNFIDNSTGFNISAIIQIKTEAKRIGKSKLLKILEGFNPNTAFKHTKSYNQWEDKLKDNNIFERGSFRVIVSGSGFTQEVYKLVTYYNNKNELHPIILMHFPKGSEIEAITPKAYKKSKVVKLENFEKDMIKFDLYYKCEEKNKDKTLKREREEGEKLENEKKKKCKKASFDIGVFYKSWISNEVFGEITNNLDKQKIEEVNRKEDMIIDNSKERNTNESTDDNSKDSIDKNIEDRN